MLNLVSVTSPLCSCTAYLVYVVDIRSLIRPVVVTLLHSIFTKRGEHHNDDASTLPHHLNTQTEASHIHQTKYDDKKQLYKHLCDNSCNM